MSKHHSSLQSYKKPWLPISDQIDLLKKRGMIINDAGVAVEFLKHVNYYRFSGFCLAFESSRHRFRDGVTFENVKGTYEFDRSLRDVVTEALEVVELDVRTAVAYHFGEKYGAFGHGDPGSFFKHFNHSSWAEKLKSEAYRSREEFVSHFKSTYKEFPSLPIWVVSEIMSFGALSHMCNGMLKPDQTYIARRYKLQRSDWVSWMHHLSYTRNLCAHHARLWDRIWSIKPQLPYGFNWRPPHLLGNNRLFSTLLILNYLMGRCPTVATYAMDWRSRVENLIDNPPAVSNATQLMGLTSGWKTHPLWK